jgi:inner membrane transporter RhtA
MPVGMVLLSMVSIQVGAAFAKGLFPHVGATGATALRLLLATLMLVAVFRPWRMRVSAAQWRPLIVFGVSLGLMNLLFYRSLETLPLGLAIALEFTGPLAVALLGSRRWIDLLWVALAVLGLGLLLPNLDGNALDPRGMAYALGAGVCWALYIVYGQRAGMDHGPQTVALGSVIAAVVVVPIGVVQLGAALFAPALLPLALAVALLSTALPYSLEMVALTRLPARTFGMLMSLEPAIGALSGLLFLHEQLSQRQWLAIVAIIVASAGSTLTSSTPRAEAGCGEG